MKMAANAFTPDPPQLKRAITLPFLLLYGLGVTIGAGIYVLVGETAREAGQYAPSAFILSAIVMAFSAATFAEFVTRIPKCAGEAIYIGEGFRREWLKFATGLMVVLSAIVAAAAISLGCAGYLSQLVPLPVPVIAVAVAVLMGAIASWGISESVTFAAMLTLIEVLGLAIIIVAGVIAEPEMFVRIPSAFPPLGDIAALQGVLGASLIAFFAFIGFDDVVNLAEEARDPVWAMPRAIIGALVAVTVIYFLVVFVAVQTVAPQELAGSRAPVGLLFERLTGLSPLVITLIAIFATANGIVIQIIMAARVLYGLFDRRPGPLGLLGRVSGVTRTPLIATVAVTVVVVIFALVVPLDALAEFTSQVILLIFTLVNVALVLVKRREDSPPEGIFRVPMVLPVIGAISCVGLLAGPVFAG